MRTDIAIMSEQNQLPDALIGIMPGGGNTMFEVWQYSMFDKTYISYICDDSNIAKFSGFIIMPTLHQQPIPHLF